MNAQSKQSTSRKVIHATLGLTIVAIVIGCGWALYWWARYPHVPDVKKVDLSESIAFMSGDDFNRMTHAHRTRFVLAVVERLKEKSFTELAAMMLNTDDRRKKAAQNVQKLEKAERDQIGSQFMQLFIGKFYEQNLTQRTNYLMGMALMQKMGGANSARAREMGIPKPEELKKAMADFITKQPPRAQAQISQFMLDMSKQQEILGIRPK